MAMCEKCQKNGYEPKQMFIDHDTKGFIGPCCTAQSRLYTPVYGPVADVHVLPTISDDVEYGVEVSNKVGVRAWANYHGLQVTYERTPEQLRDWAQKQGLLQPAGKTGT